MYQGVFKFVNQVNFKKKVFFLTSISVLASLSQILIGYLYSPLIDNYDKNELENTIYYFLLLVCLYIFNWILSKKMYYKGEMLKKEEEYSIIQKIIGNFSFIKLEKMKIDNVGAWQTYLSSDVSTISSYSTEIFVPLIKGVITFTGALIIGVKLSLTLTISILLLSFLAVYIPKIGEKYIVVHKEKEQFKNEEFQGAFLQILKERKNIRINKLSEFALNNFDEKLKEYNAAALSAKKSSNLLISTSVTSGFLFTVSWLSIGLYLILLNKITFGNFVTFIILNDSFIWIFFELPIIINGYLEKRVSLNRVEQLYNDTDIKQKSKLSEENFCSLEFKNANYRYSDADEEILNDVNLLIKNKEKKAIVGQSGSGKSTLIDVMLGYNRVDRGQICLNGKFDFDLDNLQQLLSYMPQKNIIFRGTIRENIFFDKNISEERMAFINRVSGVDEIINNNLDGLDSIVDPYNEGYINLSEGEKQRICFARLLTKDSNFLVLDEPTAFLDKKNEYKILEYLKSSDETIIMITHRVGSIPSDFEVLVMNDGKVEQLVKICDIY